MDTQPTPRQKQLQHLAEKIAGYPELDRIAWLENKPEKFAEIMRGLIAIAQCRQAEEWAKKVADFDPDVRGMYARILTKEQPKRARNLLPLIDLYRFAAAVPLQPIPTPQQKTQNQLINQHR